MLTHAAKSGLEAGLVTGHPFDVVILDMQMPEMDGLTLAAEIRKQPDCQRLPLVMLTSMGQQVTVSGRRGQFHCLPNNRLNNPSSTMS